MKISLLHPSRGRASKAFSAYKSWLEKSSRQHEIEHILSLDTTDSELSRYYEIFDANSAKSIKIVANNSCVVEATNIAAAKSTGDILVYLSDDFVCATAWDNAFFNRLDVTKPQILKCDDGIVAFNAEIITNPVMTRQAYEWLGYFWHPEYKSMFVDNDLFHVARANAMLVLAQDILIRHEHYITGRVPNDETYKRSAAFWQQGEAVFNRRKAIIKAGVK